MIDRRYGKSANTVNRRTTGFCGFNQMRTSTSLRQFRAATALIRSSSNWKEEEEEQHPMTLRTPAPDLVEHN